MRRFRFQIALALIILLAVSLPVFAGLWWTAGLGGPSSWQTWNGGEEGWGDTANNLIVVVSGKNVGDDEISQGYAASTFADAGSVTGVVSGFRTLNGTDQYFNTPSDAYNVLTSTNAWTVVMYVQNFAQAINDTLFYIGDANAQDAGAQNKIGLIRTAATKLDGIVKIANVVKLSAQCTADMAAAGAFWVVIGCTGSIYYAAFTAEGSGAIGQPVTWGDFPTSQRVSNTIAAAQFAPTFASFHSIGWDGDLKFSEFGWGKLIMSRTSLISGVE